MRAGLRVILPAVIAISVGVITLLGYFVTAPNIATLRLIFTDWAAVLAGLALLIGLLNLIMVHFRRVQDQAQGAVYSLVTAVMAVVTFILGALEGQRFGPATPYTEGTITNLLFNGVVVASQAALAGLIMILLVAAAIRLMRTRPNRWSILFLVTLVIVLVGWLPFSLMAPLNGLRQWLITVPASAGARGILIGVALGTVAIGLRVLTGLERPYKD